MRRNEKALLIPHNSKGELFLQDRAGHLPPPWGFFGGGIDEGETPLEAVIRETKEELDIDVSADELTMIGEVSAEFSGKKVRRHFFLYKTDRTTFTVLEGRGGYWLNQEKARKKLSCEERFDEVINLVESKA